jgi:hypothetical protein
MVAQSPPKKRRAVPTYLTIPEAAQAFGRTVRSTRKWLSRAGLVVMRGGRPCVSPERLRAEFPEAYNRMLLDRADE